MAVKEYGGLAGIQDYLIVLIVLGGCCLMAQTNLRQNSDANPYREFNDWLNHMIMPQGLIDFFLKQFGDDIGHYATCYFRDYVGGTIVYWLTAGLWHYAIYVVLKDQIFTSKQRPLPDWKDIKDAMQLAQSSIFLYAAVPLLSEFLIQNKWTKVYYDVNDIGGYLNCYGYFALYLCLVEIGIYWMHRTLHTNKFLYKYIHGLHHKYNKPTTLTPWASIAFNPVDGVLQASPYVVFLFFVPVHYFTHIFLLFFSGVWATNIHDAVANNSEPIMGAGYHTIHHTHYHYNFGQFFIFCDYIMGTLRSPDQIKQLEKRSSSNLKELDQNEKMKSS